MKIKFMTSLRTDENVRASLAVVTSEAFDLKIMLSSIISTGYNDCKNYVKYTYQTTTSPPFFVRVPKVVLYPEGIIHTLSENGAVAWIRHPQTSRREAHRGSGGPPNAHTFFFCVWNLTFR